jgi:hypothetical protein
MWFLFRTARYAAYAGGGRRGAPAPKKQAGPFGQLFGSLAVLAVVIWIAVAVPWFRCGLIAFTFVVGVVIMANWRVTEERRPAPRPGRDPLEALMKKYGLEDKP